MYEGVFGPSPSVRNLLEVNSLNIHIRMHVSCFVAKKYQSDNHLFIFKNVIILYSFLSLANFKPVRGKNCTVLYKLQIALFWSYISFTIEKKSDNLIFQDPEWSDIIEAGNNADKHQQEQYIIGVFKKNCFEKFAKLHEKHPWWRPFSGTLPD